MTTYEIGYHDVRGLRLAHYTWGRRGAPAILCFHGFLDHGLSFSRVAEALADEYYVIAVDFRGHGRSGWVGDGGYYHFHDYFSDMSALIDKLELESFSLLAHSMGGSVATGIAAMLTRRVQSIVMLEGMGPPTGSSDEYPGRLTTWVQAVSAPLVSGDVSARRKARKVMASIEVAASRLERLNKSLTTERAMELASTFTEPAEDGEGVVWAYDPLHRTPSVRPFYFDEAAPMWSAITAPILSLWGTESYFHVDRLVERHGLLQNVRIAKVPDAGHNLHHDRPDLIAQLCRYWLEEPDETTEIPGDVFEVPKRRDPFGNDD